MNDNENTTIKIPCNISGRLFARFAMYDTFVRKKAWRSPLLFALVMVGFSAICFTVLREKEQSSLLGMVLLSIGLMLPIIWVFTYILSVRNQIKKNKLSEFKTQYIVDLADDGIHITNGKEKANLKWDDVKLFVNNRECAFLYVASGKAFILPKDECWDRMMTIVKSKLNPSIIRT